MSKVRFGDIYERALTSSTPPPPQATARAVVMITPPETFQYMRTDDRIQKGVAPAVAVSASTTASGNDKPSADVRKRAVKINMNGGGNASEDDDDNYHGLRSLRRHRRSEGDDGGGAGHCMCSCLRFLTSPVKWMVCGICCMCVGDGSRGIVVPCIEVMIDVPIIGALIAMGFAWLLRSIGIQSGTSTSDDSRRRSLCERISDACESRLGTGCSEMVASDSRRLFDESVNSLIALTLIILSFIILLLSISAMIIAINGCSLRNKTALSLPMANTSESTDDAAATIHRHLGCFRASNSNSTDAEVLSREFILARAFYAHCPRAACIFARDNVHSIFVIPTELIILFMVFISVLNCCMRGQRCGRTTDVQRDDA
jgi:hypothetical protein